MIIWDTIREEAIMIVKYPQKVIGVQINLRNVTVLSKDKVYIYDLSGMTPAHRLNLDYHLGRVFLAANVSGDRPLLVYSNSVDHGTLKVFDIGEKKVVKTLQCH